LFKAFSPMAETISNPPATQGSAAVNLVDMANAIRA
jgi:hypothetical protein